MKQLRRLIAPMLLIAALSAPLIMTEAQQGRRRQRGRMTQQMQGATEPAERVGRRRYGRRGEATTTQHQTLDAANQTTDSTQSNSAQQGATGQTQSASQGNRRRRGRRAATIASDTTPTQGQQSQARKPKVTVVRRLNQARLSAAAIKTIRSMSLLRRIVAVKGNTIRPLAGNSLWQLSNGAYVLLGSSTVEPLASEMWTKDMGDGDVYFACCYCPGFDPNKDDGCGFDGLPARQNCKRMRAGDCTCKFQDGLIEGETGQPHMFQTPSG